MIDVLEKVKILNIRRVPIQKFWKLDKWEVTVLLQGRNHAEIRTCSIYDTKPYCKEVFKDYIINKILHGNQWYSVSRTNELSELIGCEINEW